MYLRRDNSMMHSRFIVSTHDGDDKYIVTGNQSETIGKMAISSKDGQVLVKIRLVLSGILSTFVISNSYERFTVVATNSSKSLKLQIHGIDWAIRPSADFRTFEIFDSQGNLVMTQKAQNYSRKGYYTLDILLPQRELFCIAVAICADTLNFNDSFVPATI